MFPPGSGIVGIRVHFAYTHPSDKADKQTRCRSQHFQRMKNSNREQPFLYGKIVKERKPSDKKRISQFPLSIPNFETSTLAALPSAGESVDSYPFLSYLAWSETLFLGTLTELSDKKVHYTIYMIHQPIRQKSSNTSKKY
jgi:hypothetical protein